LKLGWTTFFLVIKAFIDLNGEQKWYLKLFKLLDYSSNQMKKTQNKEKITLNILKLQKINEKTQF
jgi:hypothetical protein